jgi:hypothetical protein
VLSGMAHHAERPATFRDVLRIPEFRALYAASTLSWLGDYIARAAVTALVFERTQSVSISAAAFAISYAPWLLGGSVLVSLAERHPTRTVMIWCDVVRMIIMTVVAVTAAAPGSNLAVILVLLLCSALFGPPFEASRSALLPTVLIGDKYVVGLGLHTATAQPAQVAGYVIGASLAVVNPRMALLINAASFAISALFVRFGVKLRPSALSESRRTHLLRETADGFRLVFATPALRAVVLLVFCGSLFAVVPEGLAAAWAAARVDIDADRGWAQGIIMGAVPLGSILGALTVSRIPPPALRRKLLRPLAVATPLALVPAIFDPPVTIVAILAGLCGFAIGGLVPIANAQFVQALPNAYRARAFGVVQGGLQLLQGTAVLVTGALAHTYPLTVVVGLWSLVGVSMMVALSLTWPSPRAFARAVAVASATNNGQVVTPPLRPQRRTSPVTGVGRHRASTPRPGTIEP